MPRRREPPRLYLDPKRRTWAIRDGEAFHRLGIAERDRAAAEKELGSYLASKHEPAKSDDPLIVDVLNVYAREHLQHTTTAANASYGLASLADFFRAVRVSELTDEHYRRYARDHRAGIARRDLETLRAGLRFYQKGRRGSISFVPVILPPKPDARTRWLTRSEAARLLWAARRTEHLRRFILLGLYTGSRSKNIFGLRWDQIDLNAGVMRRRPFGEREATKKRAPPVRLGRKILSHLRRWYRLDGVGVFRDRPQSVWVITFEGKPIRGLKTSWPKAVKRAGLAGTGVTPHALRRTRATWLMQAGVMPFEGAGHLGMSVETLLRVYAQHHPDWQKTAAEV